MVNMRWRIKERIDTVTGANVVKEIQGLRAEIEDPLTALALRLVQLQEAQALAAEREAKLLGEIESLRTRLRELERRPVPERAAEVKVAVAASAVDQTAPAPNLPLWLALGTSLIALLFSLLALST
jgi:predicted nuclease with TOPRIM domain